jgi:lipopolysaccharide transport system ATP-binding protein
MRGITIRVEELSKRYLIGEKSQRPTGFWAGIKHVAASPFAYLRRINKPPGAENSIWALKDVTFNVNAGEVVSIIGRNGAGKSTLLKILSRITEPTAGRAYVTGRVGSLLEVGTGFHPELTGRENIFLNGAILGMRQSEIREIFDAIVDFSGLEKFLDTPVKRYSSGMYVRLGFAVAAHLQTEILLVDEVLAVGDTAFQKKCISKISDVVQAGRTVLLVSHNMNNVARLSERAIWLDEGQIIKDGNAHEVVNAYLHSGIGISEERAWPDMDKAPGDEIARLRAVRVRDWNGNVSGSIDIRKPVSIELEYDILREGYTITPSIHLYNQEGILLFMSSDMESEWQQRARPLGRFTNTVTIPGNFLTEGTVIVGTQMFTIAPSIRHFYVREAVAFQVVDNGDSGSVRGQFSGSMPGVIRPMLQWNTRHNQDKSQRQ